jgi:hypothetical protein
MNDVSILETTDKKLWAEFLGENTAIKFLNNYRNIVENNLTLPCYSIKSWLAALYQTHRSCNMKTAYKQVILNHGKFSKLTLIQLIGKLLIPVAVSFSHKTIDIKNQVVLLQTKPKNVSLGLFKEWEQATLKMFEYFVHTVDCFYAAYLPEPINNL